MAQLETPPAEAAPVAVRSAAAFPRVDLLPERISEQARVRRARLVLVGSTVVAIAAVGALYMSAQGEVASAQEGLDAAQAQSVTLNAQVATYAEVPKTMIEVQAAQAQLTAAMSGEVRFSYLLNDLAITTPKNVALITYVAQLGNTQAANPDGTADTGVVGSAQFTGEATSYSAVASWLDSQAKQKTQTDVLLSSAAKTDATASTPATIAFSSSANYTQKALSHRYDQAGS